MFKNKQLLAFAFFLSVVIGISSCTSKFEKLRASNDITKKYQEALRLYGKKDYNRALLLLDDLVHRYRGRAEAEDIYYYFAYTNYKLKDYVNARYHFKIFAETYPKSTKAEECRFMAAHCYYLESPKYSLDQKNTVKAIDALQLFINLYPKSARVAEASKLINDLRNKLEKKSYANAKLFLDIGDYRSAVIACKNSVRDYPDTKYAEELEFLTIKAQYLFAKNSFEKKQEERFNETIQYCTEFLDTYSKSDYVSEIKNLKRESELGIVHARKILIAEEQRLKEDKHKR